ncbi:AraC family transcriptional regulator [Isoalcanivorax indicus]|uniref:AraC family transcriptional regulator n=1 Tax=Isoalcanivorax indicus TaxID=2202653 RepID=UPI000DB9F906|nr:AraC family transcriptional regulator [Isoalcanivorax indicus]
MSPDLALAYCRMIVQTLGPDQADLARLTDGTGIDVDTLLHSEGYLDWHGVVRLIDNLNGLTDTADIALRTGLRALPAVHGPMGMAAMACPNLGEAMQMFARFNNTRTRVFSSDYRISGDTLVLRLVFHPPANLATRFLTESALASAYACLVALCNRPIDDATLCFNYPAPPHVSAYYDTFPGCTLVFDAAEVALRLPARYAAQSLATHDQDMLWLAVQQCEARQESLRQQGSTSDQVLALLHRSAGRADLDGVAALLHVSPRTLIRRLRSEGTRFRQLRDQTQSRRASQLLSLPHYTVAAVAADLGYTDTASFRRAFHRWFGTSPDQFRRSGSRLS